MDRAAGIGRRGRRLTRPEQSRWPLPIHRRHRCLRVRTARNLLGDRIRLAGDLHRFARYVESGGLDTPTGRRVAGSPTPDDDQPRTPSERITDILFGERNG